MPRHIPLVALVVALASTSCPAWTSPKTDCDIATPRDLSGKSLAGLRIDRTERRGRNWLRYTGRYRDAYFVVETGVCERYVRQMILISPQGTDPWSRLESLRRLFNLPPAALDVDQRAELRRKGQLTLTHDGIQMTYGYKAVGIVSVISLGFADAR